jgi:hypothetical protein
MFHTYVLAYSGTVVDFDRASFLMDRELLAQARQAMVHERDTNPRPDATYDAQWVWDYYCGRHYEKYGEPFGPNVIPRWDQPGPTLSAPIDEAARLQYPADAIVPLKEA